MRLRDSFVAILYKWYLIFKRRGGFLSIKFNNNIFVGAGVKISTDAKIETRFGGTICIGDGTEILDYVLVLTYGGEIIIGSGCSINPFTIIYGHGTTRIGNNVLIAGHCMIIPSNHQFMLKNTLIKVQGAKSLGVVIEDDVWIGHGCSILDGVCIGKGAVVAAGSIVNKSVESYSVVAGVPAKVIGSRK